jgi:glutamyl-Q tRNA(Asp) synthetase
MAGGVTPVTRFAPSPTGLLHLGHAYSALLAFEQAKSQNGTFLLRIEDIDQPRCKPEFEQAIYDDLAWLGLTWPTPVLRQSDRRGAYDAALNRLTDMGLTYPCSCTRGDIRAALSAPQEGAPMIGPDGPIYPGTCRDLPPRAPKDTDAIRLNIAHAADYLGAQNLTFTETGPIHAGTHNIDLRTLPDTVGDIVLARRDIGTSYHIAVTVDDAAQGVTTVTRGADLFAATTVHVLLQRLLGLPTPTYHHHDLIRDDTGKRLAKRDDARAIAKYRADGATPADIRAMVGL